MIQKELPLPPQEQRDILKALDSLLTERVPAYPAPQGITRLQPLDSPCLGKYPLRSY
jgi:hypothetical protein